MAQRRAVFILGSLGLVALAIACSGDLVNTVYFNDPQIDWGQPPSPLVIRFWEEREPRNDANTDPQWNVDEQFWERKQQVEAATAKYWQAVEQKRWSTAAAISKKQLELTADNIDTYQLRFEASSSASQNPTVSWTKFFKAMKREGDRPGSGVSDLQAIKTGPARPFALYALGNSAPRPELAHTYFLEASKIPGPRALSARVMAARSAMMAAYPWAASPSAKSAPLAVTGRKLFAAILADPAAKRFHFNARNWLVREDFANGRFDKAAVAYLRLTDAAPDTAQRVATLASFRSAFKKLRGKQATDFADTVRKDSQLASAYISFRLHHVPYDWENPNKPNPEIPSLLAFARSVEAVGTKLTPALKAHVAELAYHVRNYSDTEKYLSGIPESGSGADLASYLRASTYDRKGEISNAISELAEFDKRYPTSALRKGAAEYRATLKIRQNDLSGALDELLKLNYAYDIAYLLDVRMSPEQVRDYVRSHATHPRAELFRISLGFRFLRQSRYDDSIAQFESVPTSKRLKLVQAGSTYADSEPGMPHYDQIPDPVQTARDLKRLESAAGSGANRAAAMYALASYFYTRRNLMLYNAALWNGGRSVLASLNTGVTTPKDADAVRAHSFEHECLYRARKVCLKLAGAFPENPVTAKALYRAATATRRLADFNPYWRSAPKSVVSYEEAASLLKQVYTKFPGDALAANARKYEKVYLEEGEEAMRYRMFSE